MFDRRCEEAALRIRLRHHRREKENRRLPTTVGEASVFYVVPLSGIEPLAYPLGEGRSIQLSYRGEGAKRHINTILPGS